MKIILFTLLLCLGASLKGQDIPHHFNETDSSIFTINPDYAPEFTIVDDCKPTQTIKTVSGKLLAICVDGKFEPWMGLAPNSGQTHMLPLTIANQDVPAIQEKRLAHKKGERYMAGTVDAAYDMTYEEDVYEQEWTCKDKHNYALLTSVDQQVHVCHKVTP